MKKFSLVEVEQTFYKLPLVKTAERWRAEAPRGFEFSIKAWQALTHLPTSPTWRRSDLKPRPDLPCMSLGSTWSSSHSGKANRARR